MIFELVRDYANTLETMPRDHPRYHILKLLDEAICRDVHFIDRHPTTLFQCMWNTCWWYDCPEAVEFFDLSQEQRTHQLPWQMPLEFRLSTLLVRWRSERERDRPNLVWIRSTRPPPLQLGTAQKALLRGHSAAVNCLAYSADGRYLATGSEDQTARLWEAGTNKSLFELKGHTGAVTSVAFSTIENRLVTGSRDMSARLGFKYRPLYTCVESASRRK